MFIGCADADNARVICDLPATGIGDPNAGRARQNLRDGEGEADADDYLVCIHLPFIKADESLGRNRSYLPTGMITYCFQALMKTVWPAILPSCCLTPMRGPCMEPSDSGRRCSATPPAARMRPAMPTPRPACRVAWWWPMSHSRGTEMPSWVCGLPGDPIQDVSLVTPLSGPARRPAPGLVGSGR